MKEEQMPLASRERRLDKVRICATRPELTTDETVHRYFLKKATQS